MTSKGAEKMQNDTIGVDISKDHLDAHRLGDGESRRFANDKSGHEAFVKWLAHGSVQRVVFEPTGPYHRAFERALGAAGVPYAKVNPRQARRFAEAIGSLAKTDRLDAAMLARMGAMLELKTRPPRSEALLDLKELHLACEALVKDRTAAKNRRKILTAPLLKRQNAQRLEQIKRQIAAIEAAILEQVEADPDLALTSIPGVSAITAFALPIEMPELGAVDAGQAVSQVSRSLRGVPLDRTCLYPGRPSHGPPSHLHASPRCNPVQSGYHERRKAGKGRPHRRHAQARRPRKRPPEGQPKLESKTRLIKTDTLERDEFGLNRIRIPESGLF